MTPATLLEPGDLAILQHQAGASINTFAERGDRIVFTCSSSALLLLAALAATRLGVIPVLTNPALTDAERQYIIDDCGADEVIDELRLRSLFQTAARAALQPFPSCRPMHYTSGTSGRPKGVWCGLDDDKTRSMYSDEQVFWRITGSDVHLVCAPLYHSAPFRLAASTVLAGGSIVVIDKFSPEAFFDAVLANSPTTTFMTPAHLHRIRLADGAGSLRGFRLIAHAGAPCPVPLKEWALAATPSGSVWEFYGSTEGQFTACSGAEWSQHRGTVGRARPGREIRIDRHGLIWCKPPAYARFEYWNDPDKTAAAWDGDWFTVFDLGEIHDGYLYVNSRRDDLIITGGVNVYPVEVERALQAHPELVAVAVVGVENERWGQEVCAAVCSSLSAEEITAFARTVLAPYKIPKRFVAVDHIPLNHMGKVDKKAVAALFDSP